MATLVVTSHLVPIQNCASSSVSTSQLPSSSSSFTVKYLVNSCGLQLQSAIAASRKLDKKGLNETNIHRSDSVLNLFKSYGLDATHIAEIISKRPRVLYDYDCDKYLRPKMEFLAEIGFSGSVLGDLIALNPNILLLGLNYRIKPNFEYLRNSLGSNERARAALMACPFLLTEVNWKSNIDIFLREGVAVDMIFKLISRRRTGISGNVDDIVRAVNIVKKLGIEPASPKFFIAVLEVACHPVWEKKVRLFESFGFSKEDILSLLKRHPHRFAYSEKRLRSSFDFFVNTMKLNPKTIGSRPDLLGCSIEKRVRPRYNVLKLLLSKKLLGEGDAELVRALHKTEEHFLNDYVYKHLQQVPSLLEAYQGERITKETLKNKEFFLSLFRRTGQEQ